MKHSFPYLDTCTPRSRSRSYRLEHAVPRNYMGSLISKVICSMHGSKHGSALSPWSILPRIQNGYEPLLIIRKKYPPGISCLCGSVSTSHVSHRCHTHTFQAALMVGPPRPYEAPLTTGQPISIDQRHDYPRQTWHSSSKMIHSETEKSPL